MSLEGNTFRSTPSEDSYRKGLLNLWDYEKWEMLMKPTFSKVIREVLSILRNYFDIFGIRDIEIVEAKIDDLLEPEALGRLKLVELGDNNEGEGDQHSQNIWRQ